MLQISHSSCRSRQDRNVGLLTLPINKFIDQQAAAKNNSQPSLKLCTHTHKHTHTVPFSLFVSSLQASPFWFRTGPLKSHCGIHLEWDKMVFHSSRHERLQFSLQAPLRSCNALKGVRAQLLCYDRRKCQQRGRCSLGGIQNESSRTEPDFIIDLAAASFLYFHRWLTGSGLKRCHHRVSCKLLQCSL